MPARAVPPFHVEHVGSFLRPERLLAAAREAKAGTIGVDRFREVQDACVADIVRFQEGLGLPSITDGEFRRRSWSAGFIDAIPAFGLREGSWGSFRSEKGEVGIAASPYAKAKLKRVGGIATDEFAYLKSIVKRGTPKVTIPSPPVMHFFLGPRAVDERVYPDIAAYFDDLVAIYREEIAALGKLGCTYLQLDDTALPCNCDRGARADVKQRGEDPDALTATYATLVNRAIQNRPSGMTVGIHLCRGNLKGAWMAEGGYEPIAEALFNRVEVDVYFLEYDTARAGDFAPLRHVPKSKFVVLGLVSTKTPQLESKDELKRRIEAAARHVPIDRLGLSPQCGFSSGSGGGQPITMDDTKRKLELIKSVAAEIWG
jgi:5-methyltetrahydropteroyltriglutamate--homocysteine methyltransferase